jgi:hypothetical protein
MHTLGACKNVALAISLALLAAACSAPAIGERFEVRFDGIECTVSGPDEVPTGDHRFVLYDQTGQSVETLLVGRLVQGKTFQDLLDKQSEPGEWIRHPSWVKAAVLAGEHGEEADGGQVWPYFLKNGGEHYIILRNLTSHNHWLCSSFQVVESSSE